MTHSDELKQMQKRLTEMSKEYDGWGVRLSVFFGAVLLALNDLILDLNGEYKEDE